MTDEPNYCGATIEGQKMGRIVAWRRSCRNRVKNPGDRCRWHRRGAATLRGRIDRPALETETA